MPKDLQVTQRIVIPGADLAVEFSRASGPGGQHVNTTETRVRLRFDLEGTEALWPAVKHRIRASGDASITQDGQLLLVCDTHRSRHQNMQEVRERLIGIIVRHLQPPKRRKKTRPSRGAVQRRLKAKKVRGRVKANRKRVDDD